MRNETRIKISNTLKERYRKKEIVANMTGAHSKESRMKMANTKKTLKLTSEHKNNISKGLLNSEAFKCSFNQDKKDKTSKTNYDRYGVNCVFKSDNIKSKIKQSNLINNGVEYPMQSQDIINKRVTTYLNKYGVENPQQNKKIFEKTQKTGFNAKQYKNSNLYYRGTYELNFLEKYYDKINDLQNGLPIKYRFKEKNRIYFPDFYKLSENLIIEIKSSYYYDKYKDLNEMKKNTCLSLGYNYIFIIDKDYSSFEKLINTLLV